MNKIYTFLKINQIFRRTGGFQRGLANNSKVLWKATDCSVWAALPDLVNPCFASNGFVKTLSHLLIYLFIYFYLYNNLFTHGFIRYILTLFSVFVPMFPIEGLCF